MPNAQNNTGYYSAFLRLRALNGIRFDLFRVPSEHNPGDPMSRANSFPTPVATIRAATSRHKAWEHNTKLY